MIRKRKKILGVGINDVDYFVLKSEHIKDDVTGRLKHKILWECPYYSKWVSMISRCYSARLHERLPRYKGCTVHEDWKYFSNFRAWMETQDWEGKHLDKDLLCPGNKHYSPETCCFIPEKLNLFILECNASRGEFPIGVSWRKDKGKFRARCNNPFTRTEEHLGYFENPMDAHKVWLARKLELCHEFSGLVDDHIFLKLVERYKEYTINED